MPEKKSLANRSYICSFLARVHRNRPQSIKWFLCQPQHLALPFRIQRAIYRLRLIARVAYRSIVSSNLRQIRVRMQECKYVSHDFIVFLYSYPSLFSFGITIAILHKKDKYEITTLSLLIILYGYFLALALAILCCPSVLAVAACPDLCGRPGTLAPGAADRMRPPDERPPPSARLQTLT